jgi:hypothetical protein
VWKCRFKCWTLTLWTCNATEGNCSPCQCDAHITPQTYKLNTMVVESLWCNSWGRRIVGRPDGHFTLLIHKGLYSSLSSYRQCLSAERLFKDHRHRPRESNTYMPPGVFHPSCDVTTWALYIYAVSLFSILSSTTNKMQSYTIFFIIVNSLHVSDGFSARSM